MIFAVAALALAQIAASADHLNSGPEGFIVNTPTEYANSPLPCISGLKLQRYHRGFEDATVSTDAVFRGPTTSAPTGWYDVDATKPHDGDYRCVRDLVGQTEGDLGNKTDYVITHEPYDGFGIPFPASPTLNQTWHGFRWDGQAWKWAELQVTDPRAWKYTDTGMNACGMDAHLHAKGAKFDSPDVKGAKTPPIGTGGCYRDLDDSPVLPRGKKLEAKR